jgi:hypothetical protein
MSNVQIKISSGICGMETIIRASCDDMQNVRLQAVSGCSQVMLLAQSVTELDALEELFSGFGKGKVMDAAKVNIRHAACPVPSAILKAVEAAAGYALKKDVYIVFE